MATKRRGTRGDGSIYPEYRNGKPVKNCWRVAVPFGCDQNGKRIRVQRTVHGTKAEARKVRDQIKNQYKNVNFDARNETFSSYVVVWENSLRTSGRANEDTIRGYMGKITNMERFIGNKKLMDVTARDIESALSTLRNEGKSGSTLHQVYAYTKRVFELAVNHDVIVRNPCSKITAPKIDEPQRNSLTAQEIALLNERLGKRENVVLGELEAKENRQEDRGNTDNRSSVMGLNVLSSILAVRIALSTGMRRGEICGLLWDSVDLPGRKITVRRSLTPSMDLKSPKTQAGWRTVSIDAGLARQLTEWMFLQRDLVSTLYGDDDRDWNALPVCCSSTGGLYAPNNLERWWRRFRVEIGFPNLQLHELRHTQATQLLGNGVDVRTVSERLGHKKASTTMDIYAHAIPENDEDAADLIGNIIKAEPDVARITRFKTA